jgi:cell division septation protein DedD
MRLRRSSSHLRRSPQAARIIRNARPLLLRPRMLEKQKSALQVGTAFRITEGRRPPEKFTTCINSRRRIAIFRFKLGWRSRILPTVNAWTFASTIEVRSRAIASSSAAKEIDMLGPGTARVRLTVVQRPANVLPSPDTPTAPSPPPPPVISETPVTLGSIAAKPALLTPRMDEPIVGPRPASGAAMQRFAVQAGAFADRERAEALRSAMANEFAEARTWIDATRNPPLWKVLVGREMTKEQATALALRVRKQNGAAIVVPEVASASPETEVPVP